MNTNIDIKKIKPGDRIVAEFEVCDVPSVGKSIWVRSGSTNSAQSWIVPEHIIEHKPKPIELKIGDTFPFMGERDKEWTIVGIHGDTIWGNNPTAGYTVFKRQDVLDRLRGKN